MTHSNPTMTVDKEKNNPTTLSVDERIDKLIVSLIADGTNTWMPPTYEDLNERIKSLIKEICEEAIGLDDVYDETSCYDSGHYSGRQDLRDEQRTKLNKILEKGNL